MHTPETRPRTSLLLLPLALVALGGCHDGPTGLPRLAETPARPHYDVIPADPAPGCTTVGSVTTCVFGFTGGGQTWTVPAEVSAARFVVHGAAGGSSVGATTIPGGLGATVEATLAVTPGENIGIWVGGQNGFGGGGAAGIGVLGPAPGAGGGATLVVRSGTWLIAAGGGGGAGAGANAGGGNSGSAGANGTSTSILTAAGGGGAGTSTAGGSGGAGSTQTGSGCTTDYTGGAGGAAGAVGQGGAGGGLFALVNPGGGGGGGYYGGGGGGTGATCGVPGGHTTGGGGGGGSSYNVPSATDVTLTDGARAGNGLVIVEFTSPYEPPSCEGVQIRMTRTAGPDPAAAGAAGAWTVELEVTACEALTDVSAQGGGSGWASINGSTDDGSIGSRKVNRNNEVLLWEIGTMAAGAVATATLEIAGTVGKKAACGSELSLTGQWSATANAGAGAVKMGDAGPVTIQVGC